MITYKTSILTLLLWVMPLLTLQFLSFLKTEESTLNLKYQQANNKIINKYRT